MAARTPTWVGLRNYLAGMPVGSLHASEGSRIGLVTDAAASPAQRKST